MSEEVVNPIEWLKTNIFDTDPNCTIKIKGKNSICSTCINFDGDFCKKKRSFAGFASKLEECSDWEVCNG